MAIDPVATRPRNKAIAGLLGLLFGVIGLHRRYLGQRGWWLLPVLSLPLIGHALRQPVWFREWSFFAFALLAVIAWVQTLVICLMPAARFNERFNATADDVVPGGVIAVVIAVVTLMVASITLMSVLAIALEGLYLARES